MDFKIFYALVLLGLFAVASAFPRQSSCDCRCGVRGRKEKIVGGVEAQPHDFPWIVGLFRQGKLYCGATLISANYLLTAAHCVDGMEASEIKVYLGGHNITKDYTDVRRVRKIIQHEQFNIFSFNNDIALIKLFKPVKFGSKVQPACLPDGSVTDYSGSLSLISGWGRTAEKKSPSSVLRTVVVPVWSREQCKETPYGPTRITENMICSGYPEGGKDACQGDSGGPLQYESSSGSIEIIGITSWGRGCARPNLPGIYTNVVNYLDWIDSNMDGECLCQPKIGSRNNLADKYLAQQQSTN